MLTKNAKAFFAMGVTNTTGINIKRVDGQRYTYPTSNGSIENSTNHRIYVGNGTTEPTANDYALESRDTLLSLISTSYRFGKTYDENYMLSCTTTWKNNTSNPITITELAYIDLFSNSDMGINTDIYNIANASLGSVMLAREIISPVVIQPNETYAFTMVIG